MMAVGGVAPPTVRGGRPGPGGGGCSLADGSPTGPGTASQSPDFSAGGPAFVDGDPLCGGRDGVPPAMDEPCPRDWASALIGLAAAAASTLTMKIRSNIFMAITVPALHMRRYRHAP